MKGSHTGQVIAEEMNDIRERNKIKEKLSCGVSDNASRMKKAFQVLNILQSTTGNRGGAEDNFAAENMAVMDDEDLWNDLPSEEQETVYEALVQHCTERLACFAYSLQLYV